MGFWSRVDTGAKRTGRWVLTVITAVARCVKIVLKGIRRGIIAAPSVFSGWTNTLAARLENLIHAARNPSYEVWRERRALGILIFFCAGALALGSAIQTNASYGWLQTVVYGVRDFAEDMYSIARFSTAFVALVASLIAYFTLRHRRQADSKTEWWKRVQFAIELATDKEDEVKQDTGLWLIEQLQVDYRTATRLDRALLGSLADEWGDELVTVGDDAFIAEKSQADEPGVDEEDELQDERNPGTDANPAETTIQVARSDVAASPPIARD